jgi:hypothetical protein
MTALLSLLSHLWAAQAAEPVLGVDWVPFGRGDLAWVEEQQLSGALLGELDGMMVPSLSPWAGAAWRRWELLGSAQIGAWRRVTYTAGLEADERTVRRIVVLRPALEGRRYLIDRESLRPLPWVGLGGYAALPLVRYESEAWTAEEQAGWEEAELQDRERLGALGLRLSGGAELLAPHGIIFGLRASAVVHRGKQVDEDVVTISTLIRPEAALMLGFEL